MLKTWTLPCLLLLTAACGIRYPAYAADTPPTAPASPAPALTPATTLSLQDCIAIAQKNEVDVLVGRNSVTTAKTQVTQAKSAYYPQIGVNYNAFNYTAGTQANLEDQTGTQLVISQNIWDGGLRENTVRSSKAGVVVATKTLLRTQQTVTFTVTGDFFTVLQNKKLVDVSVATVKYLQEELAQVQAQITLGAAAKYTALPIQASLATAKVALLAAQNNVRTALVTLQESMGLAPQADFDVQEFTPVISKTTRPMDDYLQIALHNRPDIDAAHADIIEAKTTVSSARINLYPRPVISANYDQPILTSGEVNSFNLTGGIALNLFSGGANQATLQAAKAALNTANVQSAQVIKTIQAEIQTAYLTMTNAYQQLDASNLSVQAAQSNYDAQIEVNKQGLGITLDLLNAQQQLTTAQSNAVQARYAYYTAVAQLEYAMGTQGGLYGN